MLLALVSLIAAVAWALAGLPEARGTCPATTPDASALWP